MLAQKSHNLLSAHERCLSGLPCCRLISRSGSSGGSSGSSSTRGRASQVRASSSAPDAPDLYGSDADLAPYVGPVTPIRLKGERACPPQQLLGWFEPQLQFALRVFAHLFELSQAGGFDK